MATITASLFAALDGVVDPMVGDLALPVLQRRDGRGRGRHPRCRRDALRPRDLRQLRRRLARARGRRAARTRCSRSSSATCARSSSRGARSTFDWRNSEQLQGDLVEAVTSLKNDPSIDRIAISGCVSIVRQLLDAGLLDELHLFVHPATAGSGLRLFDDGAPARFLKLLSATPFQTGVVHLVYAPTRTRRPGRTTTRSRASRRNERRPQ